MSDFLIWAAIDLESITLFIRENWKWLVPLAISLVPGQDKGQPYRPLVMSLVDKAGSSVKRPSKPTPGRDVVSELLSAAHACAHDGNCDISIVIKDGTCEVKTSPAHNEPEH